MSLRFFRFGKLQVFLKMEFDAYIFTGDYNNISDGLLPIHRKEIEFIITIKGKKFFASCFMHQLFGEIFGGKVAKREKRFFGWNNIIIKQDDQIFNGLNDPFFLNLNCDEIVEKPIDARVLAMNEDCNYQILSYGESILTCQSHLEILKQEAIELINMYKEVLLKRCSDLDEIVQQTQKFADDNSNKIFMTNITRWLTS